MKKSRSLQRQELIMQMLTSQPSVSIDELMQRLKVSEWTLRRDMSDLEDRRLIVRHYGGASIAQTGQNQYIENMENFQRSMKKSFKKSIMLPFPSMTESTLPPEYSIPHSIS